MPCVRRYARTGCPAIDRRGSRAMERHPARVLPEPRRCVMERPMSRRDLLMGSAGTMVVAGLSGTPAMAAEEHAGHGGRPQGLIDATNACVAVGEECLAHCLAMFASGDTSLAACAKRVSEMMPVCRAVSALATMGAERLGQFLGPCIDV